MKLVGDKHAPFWAIHHPSDGVFNTPLWPINRLCRGIGLRYEIEVQNRCVSDGMDIIELEIDRILEKT